MSHQRKRRRRYAAAATIVLALGVTARAGALAMRDNLYAVKALSPSEAWVVGNFGAVYHTRDGGRSWRPAQSKTKSPLFGVDFADAQHGWIVGKSALILHTADGGGTWTPQTNPIPSEKHLFAVRAVDSRTVWAVGDWGAITVTHDGGATWQDRSLGVLTVSSHEEGGRRVSTLTDDVILYDVSFPDAQHGYIVGEFGTVLATGDGGATWEKRDVGTEKTLFGVSFATPERGWAVGIDGLILRTADGGRTWEVQRGRAAIEDLESLGFLDTLKNPGLYAVSVVGAEGVVVGDTGTLLVTRDGGATWQQRELPESQRLVWLRGVSLVPGGTAGFVVGAEGFSRPVTGDGLAPVGPNAS